MLVLLLLLLKSSPCRNDQSSEYIEVVSLWCSPSSTFSLVPSSSRRPPSLRTTKDDESLLTLLLLLMLMLMLLMRGSIIELHSGYVWLWLWLRVGYSF